MDELMGLGDYLTPTPLPCTHSPGCAPEKAVMGYRHHIQPSRASICQLAHHCPTVAILIWPESQRMCHIPLSTMPSPLAAFKEPPPPDPSCCVMLGQLLTVMEQPQGKQGTFQSLPKAVSTADCLRAQPEPCSTGSPSWDLTPP